MDCFAPSQFIRLDNFHQNNAQDPDTAVCAELSDSSRRSQILNQLHLPTKLTFLAIGLLNLSAFIKYDRIKVDTHLAALAPWQERLTSTSVGRWVYSWLRGTKIHAFAVNMVTGPAIVTAQQDFLKRFALDMHSGRLSWTWLTSSFIHVDLQHLLSNMAELFAISMPCTKIPGMGPFHVVAIVVGGSISASSATMCWSRYQTSMTSPSLFAPARSVSLGASGFVTAFVALAAVAVPRERTAFGILCWQVALLQGLNDLAGMLGLWQRLRARSGPGSGSSNTSPTNFAAHLGGAAFGIAYYCLVLRPATKRIDELSLTTVVDD